LIEVLQVAILLTDFWC